MTQKEGMKLRGSWFYRHFTSIIVRCDKEIAKVDEDLRWTRAEIVRWPGSVDLNQRLRSLQDKRKRLDNERSEALFRRGRN